MNISEIFIRRPVMTTLLMAALLIFGAFGYFTMPVSELPDVDFPTIEVSASLPGADPDTMASAVATPLESEFSTISGVDSMSSSSSQGRTEITLTFNLDRNIDAAAEDVQAAISAASRQLPSEMPAPPTLRKVNPADSPIMYLSMGSQTLPLPQVDRYAEGLLARQLSTLDGVAQVNVYGSQKFAVRIEADPTALAARGIAIDQVAAAANAANPNLPTGELNGPHQSVMIKSSGQLNDASQFADQIIAYKNGAPVKVGDVAKVVNGVENPYVAGWNNGHRAIVLAIQRQPGSNTIRVVDEVRAILPHFLAQLPASLSLHVLYDRSESIRASISDVQFTLLLAALLVVGVIFAFLRTLSATFIPSMALPIAIIGTFAGMSFMGYSLDNLSLMALTLSVGFVVDDAIVMLENIVRHVEAGEPPLQAALKGSREIAFTILSMTASLAAVFIPLVFMGGLIGRLLHEFSVTIVLAIVFSGVVSVTLTPLLCSRILKPEHERTHNAIYQASERIFNRMHGAYERSLAWSLSHRRVILGVFFASLAATVLMFMVSPQDFLPSEDTGQIIARTEAANGTSFDQMAKLQQEVAGIISKDPNVDQYMSVIGFGASGGAVNSGILFMKLKPLGERAPSHSFLGTLLSPLTHVPVLDALVPRVSSDDLIHYLQPKASHIPGISVYMVNPPAIRTSGRPSKSEYQYTLQGLDQDQLQDASTKLMNALADTPGFTQVTSDLQLSTPAVSVTIDRERAAALNVTPAAIETALSAAYGGGQISQIYASSDTYKVVLELLPEYQSDPNALPLLYVTASDGKTLVPLRAVTKIEPTTMPLSVNHQGQLPSVTISFNLDSGYALSYAVSKIDALKRTLAIPATIQAGFQGSAQAFQSSTSSTGLLLMIALVTVYIVLGILYESFIHPLTILSGLPSAAVGALITLYIFGIPLSLYAFVGMIMLIGIVKKNAIMMIDFALDRQRRENVPAEIAIHEAAIIRFRPIMMTTMAALMGTLPIAIGFGEGAETRRPLGVAVVGGLLLSQLLTLYITPVIYIYLDNLGARVKSWRGRGRERAPA